MGEAKRRKQLLGEAYGKPVSGMTTAEIARRAGTSHEAVHAAIEKAREHGLLELRNGEIVMTQYWRDFINGHAT